jgi:hypothetical protein
MANYVAIIEVPAGSGPLSIELSSPLYPQSLAGVLWRYDANKNPEGKAGEFTPRISTLPIGSIANNRDKLYLLEGAVLHHSDPQPTPYQVVVSLVATGRALHSEVPPENGTGEIKDKDVPFVYRFQVKEAP